MSKIDDDTTRRVPRPKDRFVTWMRSPHEWHDGDLSFPWAAVAQDLAQARGVRLRADSSRAPAESCYLDGDDAEGPAILLGARGESTEVCTSFLHELAHHLLATQGKRGGDDVRLERAAWTLAGKLAQEHRLPFDGRLGKLAVRSYVAMDQARANLGSKSKNRNRPAPKTAQLVRSREFAQEPTKALLLPQGRKGRRHLKRYLKHEATRARRRQPIDSE